METESILIFLIVIAGIVGLIAVFSRKKDEDIAPATGTITTTMKTGSASAKTPDSAKVTSGSAAEIRYNQTVQQDPTITLFEDRTIRQVRRCPSCDGENSIYAKGCEVCGRRM